MTPPGGGDAPRYGGGAPTWGGSTQSDEGEPPHVDEAVLVRTLEPRTPQATDPGPGSKTNYYLWQAIDRHGTSLADLRKEVAADRKARERRDLVRDVVAWLGLLVWLATVAALIGGGAVALAYGWWS